MIDLSRVLKEEVEKIDKWINQAATERDESATSTESTHDQTRQVANQLFNSLLEEKSRLVKLTNIVKRYKSIFVVEEKDGKRYKLMLVPDGLGGKNINGILLVAEGSLLGQKLNGLKSGDTYEINSHTFTIVDTES